MIVISFTQNPPFSAYTTQVIKMMYAPSLILLSLILQNFITEVLFEISCPNNLKKAVKASMMELVVHIVNIL